MDVCWERADLLAFHLCCFTLCRLDFFVFLSRIVSEEGRGIRLYQLSTDRKCFCFFCCCCFFCFCFFAQLDIEGNILTKFRKNPPSGLGGNAMTSLSMGKFTKYESGTKQPNLLMGWNFLVTHIKASM